MFSPERWAAAFIKVLAGDGKGGKLTGKAADEEAAEGLALLRAICPPIRGIAGALRGTESAAQLEKMIRTAVTKGYSGKSDRAMETAIHFILLLVKKNQFRRIDKILAEIEKELDQLRGILRVSLETASPPEGAFQEALKKQLMEKTGAAGIKLDTRIVPELLGGYRLRIGSELIDSSLRSQLQILGDELAHGFAHGSISAAPSHGGF